MRPRTEPEATRSFRPAEPVRFTVVLDACVLAPHPLFDVLLRMAYRDMFTPLWSEQILDEAYRTAVEKLGVDAGKAAHRFATMREIFPDASVRGHEPLIPAMTNHPKDRHVLAAAVRARAALIVTSNLKDFPGEALAPFDIVVKSPDEFLCDQFELDQNLTRAVLEEMWAGYSRPPRGWDEFSRYMEPATPEFAAAIRRMMSGH